MLCKHDPMRTWSNTDTSRLQMTLLISPDKNQQNIRSFGNIHSFGVQTSESSVSLYCSLINQTNVGMSDGLAFSIQALLSAPNPDDPLSENVAKHWKTNEAEAVETGTLVKTFSS